MNPPTQTPMDRPILKSPHAVEISRYRSLSRYRSRYRIALR